jgi:hypothetical protein
MQLGCGFIDAFTHMGDLAMASPTASTTAPAGEDAASYLDMPPERRAAAKAHAALLSRAADKVARELPISADVDDFRRVLVAETKP